MSVRKYLDSEPVTEADSDVDFLEKNSSLRLVFRLSVDGLHLFLVLVEGMSLSALVSREKVKVEPMLMENLKILP